MLRPCCGIAYCRQGGGGGGLDKALQLTIERNGPCDLTMNGTLSIAKLALAERMHGLGCPCAAEAEGRLACDRKRERERGRQTKKHNNPKTKRSDSLDKNSFSANTAKL